MVPLVIDFLKTNSFLALKEMYGVRARPSSDQSKWSLNYDQIESKPGVLLSDQCRGLVIRPRNFVESEDDIVGECDVICWPMHRFFNHGDVNASAIDWSTARVVEKLDGTMCALYFDDIKNEWHIATRSVCEANLPFNEVHPTIRTFSDLFKHALECTLKEERGIEQTFTEWCEQNLNEDCTYVYELTSPLNRVVVRYDSHRVTLLTIRHNLSGDEINVEVLGGAAVRFPEIWKLNTFFEILNFVDNVDPLKLEGAVVIDANFNRLKIKNKLWIFASRSKDLVTSSPRNALECIINGTLDDIIPLIDQDIVEQLNSMKEGLITYSKEIDVVFNELKKLSDTGNGFDRKTFAILVKIERVTRSAWEAPFFALLDSRNGTSTLEWLQNLSKHGRLLPSMLDVLLKKIRKD